MNFVYYLFLLLIIIFSISIINKNLKVSPKKIKIYLTIVITLFLLRHIALLFLCILKNSTIVHYLKSIIFLNHLSIPLIILAITYVYSRCEKLKFGLVYIIASAISVMYIGIINLSNATVQVGKLYGFILEIDKQTNLFLFSLILLGGLLIFNIFLLDRPFVNKKGIWLIIIASLVVMLENIIILGGIKVFPYSVIGDLIFLMIIDMVLKNFKSYQKK